MGALRRFFWNDDSGTTAVEYAVMLAMIIIAVAGAIGAVGSQSGGMWGNIGTDLTGAMSGS